MYKEFDEETGQGIIDLRNAQEQNMEAAVISVIDTAHTNLAGRAMIANRHEGYGILAEMQLAVERARKQVADGMKSFLQSLAADDRKAMDEVSSISNSLTQLAYTAVMMAAESRRVSDNLYERCKDITTPLEDYMKDQDDGFEEAEDASEN